jgi:tetratricopeptide (TPR) repeat protein
MDQIERNLLMNHQRDSVTIHQTIQQQKEDIINLLTTSTSISTSNVGNTIEFLGLILAVIVAIASLLAFFGRWYLRHILNQAVHSIENTFKQKSRELSATAEETKANSYLSIGQFGLAAATLDSLLKIDPNNFFAHEKLGFLFTRDILNQPERAVFHNKAAIKLKPDSLFPYINLQVALDHASHPFDEIEASFKKVLEKSIEIGADEMTYGKAKLFFADKLFAVHPNRKDEAKKLYNEAIAHFNNVLEPWRAEEKAKWTKQAQEGLNRIAEYERRAGV